MSQNSIRSLLIALVAYTCAVDAAKTSQPVVCTTSTEYVGYDGQWSPITIRVGTEEQWLSVLPCTLSQETWLVGPESCDGTIACATARGGLFYANDSSTFQPMGFYELGSNPQLGNSQFGYYGLDTIALNDDVSEVDQIIALVNTTNLWVGELGLGVQQTRINGSENRQPFLSSLVQNSSHIPSHSYGYTAGAAYRLTGVPASLTLGGVDANRFTPNNASFVLSSNYAPAVAINSVSLSSSAGDFPTNWNVNPTTLLSGSEGAIFTIDSSTPYLWLPGAVCDNFAAALNLTYNETLALYVFANDSSPDVLQEWNLTFTFEIGNLPGAYDNIKLTVPYSAFNLELSYGFPNFDGEFGSPPLSYFPVRRASSDSEYIIGRAFLQETYLMVDYERNTFSLSQALITEESVNNVNLQAITRPSDSIFPGPESEHKAGLSTGAKAGIAVGVCLGVILLAVLIWLALRRRKANKVDPGRSEKPKRRSLFGKFTKPSDSATTVSELLGDKNHPTEIPADSTNSRFELPGSAPLEMPAAEVSPTFFQSPENRNDTAQRNDPRDPAELAYRERQAKADEAAAEGSDRSASPVPPYSPAQMDQRLSNSISPYTPRHSQGFGTASSGEQGISPVGHSSGNGSERNSNSVPSPVSPDTTFSRGFQRTVQPSEPGSNESQTSGSYGQHLTPQPPARAPSRSASRSSRFVEEGLDRDGDDRNSSSRSARFSWEE